MHMRSKPIWINFYIIFVIFKMFRFDLDFDPRFPLSLMHSNGKNPKFRAIFNQAATDSNGMVEGTL